MENEDEIQWVDLTRKAFPTMYQARINLDTTLVLNEGIVDQLLLRKLDEGYAVGTGPRTRKICLVEIVESPHYEKGEVYVEIEVSVMLRAKAD